MHLSPAPLHDDPQLADICHAMVAQHQAHTRLFHGSRVDGSAGEDSDHDIAAVAPIAAPLRLARLVGAVYRAGPVGL